MLCIAGNQLQASSSRSTCILI